MNCIIIEDEDDAAASLENQLVRSPHVVHVLAKIDSVEEAVPWLRENQTDLIFLDVQLGDGLGFEIFDHVQLTTPVVFTTSYDRYMTKAFELNSISYLLKPVMPEQLHTALAKYDRLYPSVTALPEKIAQLQPGYQQRFLVRDGNHYTPLFEKDIAWFYVQNKHYLFVVTRDRKQYLYDSTLELLEQRLDPRLFFRINRQYIVSADAVKQVSPHDNYRLRLEMTPSCKEEMLVSRHRLVEFRDWLDT
jgi:two-component system response regulator LytT